MIKNCSHRLSDGKNILEVPGPIILGSMLEPEIRRHLQSFGSFGVGPVSKVECFRSLALHFALWFENHT